MFLEMWPLILLTDRIMSMLPQSMLYIYISLRPVIRDMFTMHWLLLSELDIELSPTVRLACKLFYLVIMFVEGITSEVPSSSIVYTSFESLCVFLVVSSEVLRVCLALVLWLYTRKISHTNLGFWAVAGW